MFALAKFDAGAAVKLRVFEGQGTVIHFTIPMHAPWIPLRILALGKTHTELVDADLFVLTDSLPRLSPGILEVPGMSLRQSGPASASLLADLRSDRGMEWLPTGGMWLTALTLHASANAVSYDLSIDGGGPPRAVPFVPVSNTPAWTWWVIAALVMAAAGAVWALWRPAGPSPRVA